MRLLLINPAETLVVRANLPDEIEAVRGNNPPINLLQVAAAARRDGHAEVSLIDAHAEDLTPVQVAARAHRLQPDLIGLTAVSFTMPAARAQAQALQEALPETPRWLGGLQPFLYPAETLALPEFDGLIRGEGEHPLATLCRHGGEKSRLGDEPGFYFQRDGALIDTGVAPTVADLDTLPQPAYDLLRPELYGSVLTDLHPVANAVTSRGCPYHCTYCSRSVTGKRFRAHGPAYVVENFRRAHDLGFAALLVYDEVFTIDKARVLAICDGLRHAGIDLPWMARATIGTVDEEMMRAMAAAGCRWITFGIESGSPAVLRRLGRPTDLETARQVFAAARRVGLKTLAYFMVGNPDESAADIAQSAAFMVRLDPDHVHLAVYTMYPATPLYDEAVEKGLLPADLWREFATDPASAFTAPHWPGSFSADDLFAIVRRLYRRFYLRPRVIWRERRSLLSWRAFRRRLRYLGALITR
ncbi:MAG: cobalamin-dependent protein [Candidatus Lernaella stagnicola]|nr:cobalamin-dependent protein [Candidatus Lernaella stagnicola]